MLLVRATDAPLKIASLSRIRYLGASQMGARPSGGKQLFAEIRERGYVGSYASLMRFLAPWREAQDAAETLPDQLDQSTPVLCGIFRHGQVVLASLRNTAA